MKCCANIYFNRQCLNKKVIPKYAYIKVSYTFLATRITSKKVQTIRIKDEVMFLYRKKEKLNTDLHRIHLQASQEWSNSWYIILDSIHESINQES